MHCISSTNYIIIYTATVCPMVDETGGGTTRRGRGSGDGLPIPPWAIALILVGILLLIGIIALILLKVLLIILVRCAYTYTFCRIVYIIYLQVYMCVCYPHYLCGIVVVFRITLKWPNLKRNFKKLSIPR